MSFSELLERGLDKYRGLKNSLETSLYMQLEYIDWSYRNASNQEEFASHLWQDVAALINAA